MEIQDNVKSKRCFHGAHKESQKSILNKHEISKKCRPDISILAGPLSKAE